MKYHIKILGPSTWDAINDNLDIEVETEEGDRYGATYFTRANIDSLIAKYQISGECGSGLYMWAANMIIVHELRLETIRQTIDNLVESGEFQRAFCKL